MTSVRSDQLHASRNVVSSVCCDWLVFPKKEIFLIPFRHNQFVVSIVGIHDTSFHYFSYSD